MQEPGHYREQAERARRLAGGLTERDAEMLERLARDLDDIAEDLERGAIDIRHPELMPQRDAS